MSSTAQADRIRSGRRSIAAAPAPVAIGEAQTCRRFAMIFRVQSLGCLVVVFAFGMVLSARPSAQTTTPLVASASATLTSPLATSTSLAGGSSAEAQEPDEGEETAARKGFIIGVGAGPSFHRAPGFAGAGSGNGSFALVTDFRVGYAPSDQLLLHYSNKVAWTRSARYDMVGVTGFGTTYMLRKTSPSPFLTGSFGGAVGGTLLSGADSAGYGFSVGGGYELRRHLSFDGEAMFIRLGGSNNHTVFRAGFNYLFY
jgi:hypothetical protein